MALRLPTRERRMAASTAITDGFCQMLRRTRRGHMAAPLCVAALLAGCAGGPTDPAPSPSPSGSLGAEVPADAIADLMPTDLQAETYFDMDRAAWEGLRETATSIPWRMIQAGGVQQAAGCIGQGAPTVVYINGWDSPAAVHWSLAAAQQAESNRVCMFDRPGMGLSPARRGAAPHSTPEQHAQEMFDMLTVVGETGPFVLVPWSYGGLVARAAATQRPDQVAGMVLVDASSPLQEGMDEPLQGEDGIVDTATITSTVGEGPTMGNKPVIVLQAGIEEPETPAKYVTQWRELQRQAATISANSLHAVVDRSDHAIPIRNPAAVVAATSAVVESVRAGNATLPTCPEDLKAAGVTCSAD